MPIISNKAAGNVLPTGPENWGNQQIFWLPLKKERKKKEVSFVMKIFFFFKWYCWCGWFQYMNEWSVKTTTGGWGGGGGGVRNNKKGLQLKYKRPLPSSSGFDKIQGDGRKFLDRFKSYLGHKYHHNHPLLFSGIFGHPDQSHDVVKKSYDKDSFTVIDWPHSCQRKGKTLYDHVITIKATQNGGERWEAACSGAWRWVSMYTSFHWVT